MKQNHFLATMKTCLLAVASSALLFTSCAQDGFDEESFESSVRNTQLLSPSESDISISPTVDKALTIIAWKVVNGASSYDCKVYNVSGETPVLLLDSIVDGTSFTIPRESDQFYELSIKTLGNTRLGNSDAEAPTVKLFNSFIESMCTIESGVDLYTFFKPYFMPEEGEESIIPADAPEELCFDLVAGGSYTISNKIDFGGYKVILRCLDKSGNRPTITITTHVTTQDVEGNPVEVKTVGSICTSAPLTLQNLKLDYSAVPADTKNPSAIYLSENPDESIKGKIGSQTSYYNITDGAIYIAKCDFINVPGMLFYDNNKSYCVETMIIENSRIQFNVSGQTANLGFIYTPGGFIKDLTIRNSTMWNTGEGNLQYFVRYNNSGRLDRAGYNRETQTQSVNIVSSTFYNLAYGWFANYNGFAGQKYTSFEIKNNIFDECAVGGAGIARRLLGGRSADSYGKCEFANNTYWTNGKAESEGAPASVEGATATYDTSGSALQSDPALVNPAEGNLMPTGAEQVEKKTGDPYWF